MNLISQYDLIFLNETWISNKDTTNLNINGYISEHIPGNKSKNTTKGRFSGGISFYYKNDLKNVVKVVEKLQSGIIWVKIDKSLFPFNQDVYICHLYVPPSSSKVLNISEVDILEQLELCIEKYDSIGKVYITGDFNCRTASSMDYIEFDKYIDQDFLIFDTSNIPKRSNQDSVLDYNGLRLLDLCQSTGLLIANGRISNDRNIGKFTFCSHIGQSTVDYLLLNLTDFNTIAYFNILDLNEHSDHLPISFHLFLKQYTIDETGIENDTFISRKIVWDQSKVDSFKAKLQNKIVSFHQIISETDELIDDTVQSFTRLLHDTAFETFGKTFSTTENNNMKHTKPLNDWFDINCESARRDFNQARNTFNRTKDDETRRNFTRTRTRYNKIKKKAKQCFKIKEGLRISNLAKRDSRAFWKNIRKTFKKKTDEADSLTVEDLYKHFKTVLGDSDGNTDHTNDNNTNIDFTDRTNTDDDLDSNFTEMELRQAVFSQKDNKSPGLDCISSEILKTSYDVISPCLLYLYNRMYSSGEYPRSWGEGIITPIFKKGDLNDAGNYRGITLINVLAKIYSQLLLNRLSNWAKIHDKITNNQFGFQKGKSIVDCIFILHSVISKILDSGEKLYCAFIDYEKCFDRIDRLFLWQKLTAENVSCKLVNAIRSMYLTVKSCVRYKSSYSEFFSSSIGLKQGDPSSPLLFMLFVNDIVQGSR